MRGISRQLGKGRVLCTARRAASAAPSVLKTMKAMRRLGAWQAADNLSLWSDTSVTGPWQLTRSTRSFSVTSSGTLRRNSLFTLRRSCPAGTMSCCCFAQKMFTAFPPILLPSASAIAFAASLWQAKRTKPKPRLSPVKISRITIEDVMVPKEAKKRCS